MQVSTRMHTIAERKPTTERILAAALEVFSREGMNATTREIARVAEVNEATLFRQFETKGQLLIAVTKEVKRLQAEALARIDFDDFDLRRDLTHLAEAYEKTTVKHLQFIRTMMSQATEPALTEQIMREVIEPMRARFIAYLAEGQRRGLVRDLDLASAVDAFTGMVFSGALRCSIYRTGYSRKTYRETCIDLFVAGIQPAGRSVAP
jgi:AcrR family transcriptional regulator